MRASPPVRAGLRPRGLPRQLNRLPPAAWCHFFRECYKLCFCSEVKTEAPRSGQLPHGVSPCWTSGAGASPHWRLQARCPGVPALRPGPRACPRVAPDARALARWPRARPWAPGENTAPVFSGFTHRCRSYCQPWRSRRSSRPARSEARWRVRGLLCPEAPPQFSHRVAGQLRAAPGAMGSMSGTHGLRPHSPGAAQPQRLLLPQADTEPVVTSGASEAVPRVLPGDPQNLCACSPGSPWGGAWARSWWAGGFRVAAFPGPLSSLGLLPRRSSWWARTSGLRLGGTPVWAGVPELGLAVPQPTWTRSTCCWR